MALAPDRKPQRVLHEAQTFELTQESLGVSEIELVDELRKTFASDKYRPPTLPTVALEVTALASKPNVEVKQVIALLERDAMLSGRVLKVANSPLFAGQMPIVSLHQAMVRLGMKTVRDLVLEASMAMRVFRAPGYQEAMDLLRIHSTLVAHLMRLVCRYTSFDADYAFTCGLLHDIGAAAALVALGDKPAKEARPPLFVVWPALRATHEECASIVLKSWQMPIAIEQVVGNHHQSRVDGQPHPLVAVLTVAETLAFDEKSEWDGGSGMKLDAAWKLLGLSEKQIALIEKEADDVKKHALASAGH